MPPSLIYPLVDMGTRFQLRFLFMLIFILSGMCGNKGSLHSAIGEKTKSFSFINANHCQSFADIPKELYALDFAFSWHSTP